MIQALIALVSGVLFALGLGISGMTDPVKVFSFLDVFGRWDPTLMFVMAGAIAVNGLIYQLTKKRKAPLFDSSWHLPKKTKISKRLICGSAIFGMGWGLGGYCPGPALVSMTSLDFRPIIFSLSMIVGMFLYTSINQRFKSDE